MSKDDTRGQTGGRSLKWSEKDDIIYEQPLRVQCFVAYLHGREVTELQEQLYEEIKI